MKKNIFLLLLLTITFGAQPKPTYGKNGMIVSTSQHASEAGIEILKKGGNAVDAAVAVGFALAVTSSSNGNIGGGGFMVAQFADGRTFTLDHREMAPSASRRDMFLDEDGDPIKGASMYTRMASGVPGTVDGLLKAWEDYGSGNISRSDLLAPAIRLATKGFHLSHHEAQRFNRNKDLFLKHEATAEIFIKKDGSSWEKGDRFKQKDLGHTLKRISKKGKDGFYFGKTADLIVEEMKRGNGLITHQDLANYESKYRPPITGKFKDFGIISMGPPSSGGALLINMMNMLESYPLEELEWNSSDYIHVLTEVERRAYADRAEHLGDPDFWPVPINMFTSKDYAKKRVETISMNKATPSADVLAGSSFPYESVETTHYSVVDKEGNAVSVTTTINLSYGGGFVVKGAGFFLNNEMDDFSIKPGVPNAFGLVGNEANSIAPAKRPLSSMTPTIVTKNGRPYIVIGSPGGSTIITTTMQCILNVVIHGMDIKEAVAAPRTHSQWLPDYIMIEERGQSKDTIDNLKKKGHRIKQYKWGKIGQANGILIDDTGVWGGGDTRGETTAVGY